MSETEAVRKCYPKSGIEGLRNEVSVGVPKYSWMSRRGFTGIYRTATILLPNTDLQDGFTGQPQFCFQTWGFTGGIYRTDLQDSHNFASKHNLSADV